MLQELCKDPIWLHTSSNEGEFSGIAKVPEDLVYLSGHFADFPLVPGVIELQWVQEQAQVLLNHKIIFNGFEKLKFQKFLRPNDTFHLQLTWNETKQRLHFSLKSDDAPCCSGIALVSLC